MADVRLTIAGRVYDISTSDGQEQHLVDLAALVDERARKIVGTTEVRQLLFSSLMLADEVHEARAKALSTNTDDGSRAAELEAELLLAQKQIDELKDTAKYQADTLAEAINVAETAMAETEAARAALTKAEASAALPAVQKPKPASNKALSRLADRIETLADTFEELSQ